MRRWWIMMLLLGAGIVFVPAIRRWQEARGPSSTVAEFLEALKAGDEVAAVEWMRPTPASTLLTSPAVWSPSPRMSYCIEHVEVQGGQARVNASLHHGRTSHCAIFTLSADSDGRWRISQLESIPSDAD